MVRESIYAAFDLKANDNGCAVCLFFLPFPVYGERRSYGRLKWPARREMLRCHCGGVCKTIKNQRLAAGGRSRRSDNAPLL